MAAKSKLGRTRDVKPVSFRLDGPTRQALDAVAKEAKVTPNEQARAFTVAGLAGRTPDHGVTPGDDGVTPPREVVVEYDPEVAR